MVIPFGNTLHVCGSNPDLLAEQLKPFQESTATRWQAVDTGLEEVVINLMQQQERQADAR
jgi:ribosomal silencing factor RsfS